MIGIIGKKLGMTQIFNEAGQQIPVTVVEATPNPVTKVTTKEKAGFAAVELGYGAQKVRRASKKGEREPRGVRAGKAELGHAVKAGLQTAPRVLKSVRLDDAPGKNPEIPTYNVGDVITVGIFTPGERVSSSATALAAGRTRTATRSIAGRARSDRAPTRRASSRARRCPGTTATRATRRSISESRRSTRIAISCTSAVRWPGRRTASCSSASRVNPWLTR